MPITKFQLQIAIGNEAMSDCYQVANALGGLEDKVRSGQLSGVIKDVNGNTVGSWSYEGEA